MRYVAGSQLLKDHCCVGTAERAAPHILSAVHPAKAERGCRPQCAYAKLRGVVPPRGMRGQLLCRKISRKPLKLLLHSKPTESLGFCVLVGSAGQALQIAAGRKSACQEVTGFTVAWSLPCNCLYLK